MADEPESKLSYINITSDDPFVLFKQWFGEAKQSNLLCPEAMTLATASKDAKVSARSILLRRLDDDGFVIVTDARSQKSRELEENPRAVMVFLWFYDQDGETVKRQVRIEGHVVQVDREDCRAIYDEEPLFCKMRSHVCHQGATVDWHELRSKHDLLLQDVKEGRSLDMPEHFVGFKLLPDILEFYLSESGPNIADRALFIKTGDSWTHHKIAA